jgi:hypothetical protein
MLRTAIVIIMHIVVIGSHTASAQDTGNLAISDYPRYGKALPANYREVFQPTVSGILAAVKSGKNVDISVYGHADFDVKGEKFVTKVSLERGAVAQSTLLSMLTAQAELEGISSDRLSAALHVRLIGMGTSDPKVARPLNESDRKQNRRVEITWNSSGGPAPKPRPQPPEPAPENVLRVVGFGVWNRSSTVEVDGDDLVRFVVRNQNILPTTLTITDTKHGGKHSQLLLPGTTAEMEFAVGGAVGKHGQPYHWTFNADSDSDAFIVSWQALSYARPDGQ